MIQHMLAIYIILGSMYTGWGIARVFSNKNRVHAIEESSLAILFGTLYLTLTIFFAHSQLFWTIDLKTLLTIVTIGIVLSTSFLFYIKKSTLNIKKIYSNFYSTSNIIEKIIVVIIGVLLGGSIIQNLFWPITDWDAIVLYDFRAKIIATTGSFDEGVKLGYFFQYPPYTSLLHTSLYLAGVQYAKIWYSLLYAAFILGMYSLLRKRTDRLFSLIGALLIAINPLIFEHATMAYNNLPYVIFISFGFLYLLSWIRSGKSSELFIGGIMTAASTWMRLSEPFWFFSVLMIIFGIFIHKKHIVYALISIALIYYLKQPWVQFVAIKEGTATVSAATLLPSGASNLLSLTLFKNVREVSVYLIQYVFPKLYAYMLPFCLTLYLLFKEKKWSGLIETLIFFIPLAMIYTGTLIFSMNFSEWNLIPDSAARMSMFLIPLVIYLISGANQWSYSQQRKM